MKLRLTTKLLIPLITVVILGLSVSITVAYLSAKNGLEKMAKQQVTKLSDSVSSKISTWLKRNELDIENWSNMDAVINSLGTVEPDSHRTAISQRMKQYINTHKIFNGMRIANDQGLVIASSHDKNINKVNVSKREYFKRSMKGEFYISDPIKSKTTGKPIIVISAPVMFLNQVKGVFYAVVDLSTFTKNHVDPVKIGETGYIYLVNRTGLVLAYPPDEKRIMKQRIIDFEFGRRILKMKNGILTYEYNGDKRLAGFKQDPLTGWITVTTVPRSEMLQAAHKLRGK
ncbi:MAG: cache domain-containing protein, partial [Desulfobacterales bacterium]|nr:cache domain-containing protein [Desulfobacterales bacterium]